MQEVYDQKIRDLSEEERFYKGISLTHLCREMVWASMIDQKALLTFQEIKIKFQKHLYGNRIQEKP